MADRLFMFDTRWQGTHGIGRFSQELFRRLPEFSSIGIGGQPSSPLDPLVLRRHLGKVRPGLFLSPGYNAPFGASCPFAFCLHDLNHFAPTTPFVALKRTYYTWFVRPAVARARIVFTVSEFSRQLICDWASVDSAKVVNVGNGVSEDFTEQGGVYARYDRPYFLHSGGSRRHKNLARVLEAFASSRTLAGCLMVCLGAPSRRIRATVARLGLMQRVDFIDEATDDELAGLYRGALGLVFASLQEGFGLPIIEAMACGCPVVTSNLTSMPEVAGEAAILVDPYDIDAIRSGMEQISEDAELRSELRTRGLSRAKAFRWADTAHKVREALSEYLA